MFGRSPLRAASLGVMSVLVACNPASGPAGAPSATAPTALAPSAVTAASAPRPNPEAAAMDPDQKLAPLVGKPLGAARVELGLKDGALEYVDEPPGKLKVVVAQLAGGRVELHLRYDSAILFSEDRDWPLDRIGAAGVLGIVWRVGSTRRVYGVIHEALTRD